MSTAAPAPPPVRHDPSDPAVSPRLLMTRAEFEAADECPGTRVEWLGFADESIRGEQLGMVWPRFGFDENGEYLMATERHGEIVANVFGAFWTRADRDAWQVLSQDGEVGCPTGRHRFPDVLLTRRPPEYAGGERGPRRILLNPSLVVEVLSPTTAATDLSEKPADYLSVPTVTDYLVIEQSRRLVLHHRRVPEAVPPRWDVTRFDAADAAVTLADPAVTLPLAEIYARVSFDEPRRDDRP